MHLKRVLIITFLLIWGIKYSVGQVAIKTNLALDALRIPTLGVEVGLSNKLTLELPVVYNPWKFSSEKQFKLLIAEPEIRYWFCESFNGHFMGTHLLAGVYHTKGVSPPFALWSDMKEYSYKGEVYGAGISYGYQFLLGHHWNLEATVGIGYAYVKYKKFPCTNCGEMIEKSHKNYFGPTKAALSLIYLF